MVNKDNIPVIFLGFAENIKQGIQPFPVGPIDIYQLSQHKGFTVYPASMQNYEFVFVVNVKLMDDSELDNWEIVLISEDGKLSRKIKFDPIPNTESDNSTIQDKSLLPAISITRSPNWTLIHFKIDTVIPSPGKYLLQFVYKNEKTTIGSANFYYQIALPFTPEQIRAIEADPYSLKFVRVELGCEHCPSKLKIYSALERDSKLEDEGYIFQNNLEDKFICECGNTKQTLKYLKESLHGFLGKDIKVLSEQFNYEHRFRYSQVVKLVKRFNELLEKEKEEKPFQEFIDNNLVMLAQFHAKLFLKCDILGKFKPDFVILDTSKQLLLIELEKPSLPLFKKDGHPTADLMHAYGQVIDWINEWTKHRAAVLDGLKLRSEDVMTIKGVVIAGRTNNEKPEHLQRHLSHPPYSNIEFLTLDDLSNSLLQISRDLI